MWPFVGMILAAAGAAVATLRGRAGSPNYYESQVYELTAASHRRFAIASVAFVAAFALIAAFPVLPVFPVLAAYVVFLILYGTSFVRGAVGEDE